MMLRKDLLISLLIAILSLGIAGSAFAAAERTVGSEAGLYKYGDRTTATEAAEQHKYNQERLSNVGTEAGNWEFRFDAPKTEAMEAAENHNYNERQLSNVGTEAGNWRIDANTSSPVCINC